MERVRQPRWGNLLRKMHDVVPLTPIGAVAILGLAILPLVPPFNREYLISWLVLASIIGGQAIAFDFTGGFIGVVNFGFAGFTGLGAYTSAIIVTRLGVSPWIGLFLAPIPAAFVGFLTGVLTLRLRGMFAAVFTWFISLALMGLAIKMVWLTRGMAALRCPFLFTTTSNLPYFYAIFGMVVVTYLILRRLVLSDMGLAFKAIGQNMEAARTSGINPTRYRIANFTISCAFAGWIGGFYAHYYGILTPEIMHTQNTVQVMVIAFIGGRGSLWGGAVAAYPFFVAMEMLRSSLAELPGSHLVIYGFFLVLIMIYYPGGVAHLIQSSFARFRSWPIRSLFNPSATTYQLSKQQRRLGNPDVPRAGAPEGEEEL